MQEGCCCGSTTPQQQKQVQQQSQQNGSVCTPLVYDLSQIQDDEDCFNSHMWYIQEDNKYLFTPEKFIFLYTNYKADHEEMNKHWEKLDIRQTIRHGIFERQSVFEVLSLKWKYLVRKGIPMHLMRTIFLDIYKRTYTDNQMEYQIALNIIFKNKPSGKQLSNPLEVSANSGDWDEVGIALPERKIEEMVRLSVLTKYGFEAIKRILWVFKEMYHQIDLNPMIVQITSLLLIFLKEEEAYAVLKLMVEDSTRILNRSSNELTNEEKSLHWHLFLRKADFKRCATWYFNAVSRKSEKFKKVFNHLNEIGFDYLGMFGEMINNILSGTVNFPNVLKIFSIYMNEGIKVYFRFIYAICCLLSNELLKVRDTSRIKGLFRKLGMNFTQDQAKELFKTAFDLHLMDATEKPLLTSSGQFEQSEKQKTKKIYYIPHLDHESMIVSQEVLETVWSWLPQSLKMSDGIQIWCLSIDGSSLANLYKKCENYLQKQMLILIKADNNSIFGVYSDQMLKISPSYSGSNQSFVFMLEPNPIKFAASKQDSSHLFCSKDYFSFGVEGNALMIDSSLSKGTSEPSKTYSSSILTGELFKKQFACVEMEIYTFL